LDVHTGIPILRKIYPATEKLGGKEMKRLGLLISLIMIVSLLAACATPTPEVVEKVVTQVVKETVVQKEVVKETVIVEGTPQVVEKEVTKVVEVEKVVTPTPAAAGGEIIFGVTSDFATTIPTLSRDSTSASAQYLMYDGLFRIDPVELVPIPWLVTDWEVSDDQMTYTFNLRDDVRFHDGEPLTAEDAKFTLEALINPDHSSVLRGRLNVISEVEVLDTYAFKVVLSQPYAPLLTFFANTGAQIIPKHLLEGEDLLATDFLNNPVGTGPFKFKEWAAGDHMTLVANEDYFLGRPLLDSVVFRIVPDSASLVAALKTGEVDISGIGATDIPQVQGDPYLQVIEMPSDCFYTIGANLSQERFQDKRVRQAIMYSLPREQMVAELLEGHGYITDSYILRKSWAYNPDTKPVYRYNPEKAKELLAEAGWVDTDGDGVVEKDGEPFKFALLSYTGITPGYNETIQQSLKDIGIEMDIQLLDWPTFLNTAFVEKKYDSFTVNMCVPLDPHNPTVWGCGTNAFFFCSEEFDEMGMKAVATTDREERKEYYYEMQNFLAEEQVRFLLYSGTTIRVVNTRVVVGQGSPRNYTLASFTLWPHEWYLVQR
jgi:peptide/nickel transport system substrate-binding protein